MSRSVVRPEYDCSWAVWVGNGRNGVNGSCCVKGLPMDPRSRNTVPQRTGNICLPSMHAERRRSISMTEALLRIEMRLLRREGSTNPKTARSTCREVCLQVFTSQMMLGFVKGDPVAGHCVAFRGSMIGGGSFDLAAAPGSPPSTLIPASCLPPYPYWYQATLSSRGKCSIKPLT